MADEKQTGPCPGCRKDDRQVLAGAICFDCERDAHRQLENDMPVIARFLDPYRRFADWRIARGDDLAA